MKEKKLGGRPKLANYQKRTKCFRVMFTENDYIYIQSKAEQAGLSVLPSGGNELSSLSAYQSGNSIGNP